MRISVRFFAELIVVGCITISTWPTARAQTCSQPPSAPVLNPDEATADAAFQAAVTASGGCTKAGDAGCTQATSNFNSLSSQALAASATAAQCAATGVYKSGAPLSSSDKTWYLKRSSFWSGIYQSLQTGAAAVTNGTYKLTDQDRAMFLGIASPTPQCNEHPNLNKSDQSRTPFSDCDMSVSLIGGVEQSDQSSLPSTTTPFIRLFTRAGPDNIPRLQAWAFVRLLGSPQASSTSGVVSVVTDPAGNVTTQTFSGIGTSVDYMLGGEAMLTRPGLRDYSISLVAGFGGTTPLTANNVNQAFKAPAFGTIECNTLQTRFQKQFAADNVLPGTGTNAATQSCLVNANSTTSAAGATTVTYTPVTTIGFSNQDRTSFLGKALVGFRTIDRFPGAGNLYCGDADAAKRIGPCERGIVDFLFGQDATVTGGQMRHWVFKVDAVHPLPVKSVSFLYLFGSATIRFARNTNYPPLVLQAGDVASLTGNGTGAVPNTAVVVLPLTQPNRDFYRFGAGINLTSLFKKPSANQTPVTTP